MGTSLEMRQKAIPWKRINVKMVNPQTGKCPFKTIQKVMTCEQVDHVLRKCITESFLTEIMETQWEMFQTWQLSQSKGIHHMILSARPIQLVFLENKDMFYSSHSMWPTGKGFDLKYLRKTTQQRWKELKQRPIWLLSKRWLRTLDSTKKNYI